MANPDEDYSADTSRFRAFVQQRDDDQPPAWEMRASRARVGLLAAIVIAVAIVAALIGWALVG